MSGQELGAVFVSVVPSLKNTAETMQKGGADSAGHFAKAFTGHAVWQSLFSHLDFTSMGRQHGEKWSNGVAGAVEEGSNRISKSMAGSVVAAGALGGAMGALATTAVEGFKEAVHSVEELGSKLIEVGEQFERIERVIRVHTVATGADFENLKATVSDVAATTSASFDNIASATATLAQKTGLRGGPLADLTKDIVDAQILLGKPVDIGPFISAMKSLGVPMSQADSFFTRLFNISRQLEIPLNTLTENISSNAVALSQFGVSADVAAGLVAKLSRFSPGGTIKGLTAAAKEAAKEGKEFPAYLREVVERMEHFRDIGDKVTEAKIGEKAFGARGALSFIAAIDQGVLSVEALTSAFQGPTDRASDLYEQTKTMGDAMQELRHQFESALAPLGLAITKHLGGALEKVSDWTRVHGDRIVGWFQQLGDVAIEVGKNISTAFGGVVDAFGNIEKGIGLLTGDKGLQEAGQHAIDLGHKLEGIGPTFDAMRGKFDNFMSDIKKSTAINELLGDSLKRTSDKGLVLKDNSPQVQENLKRLHEYGVDVTSGPNGELKFSASTDEARKKLEEFLKSFSGQEIKVPVVAVPGPSPQSGPGLEIAPGITVPGVTSAPPTPAPAPPPPSDKHSPLRGTDDFQVPWWINPFLWSATGGGHDTGGPVSGPRRRPGQNDTVPGWLDPLEFVVKRGPAQKFGPLLDAINNAPGYDEGGPVGGWSIPGITGGDSPWAPKSERQTEEWQERQIAAARTVERGQDRLQDLQNSIDDYKETLAELRHQMDDQSLADQDRAKLTKQYNRTLQSLTKSQRDLGEAQEDLQTDIRKQGEAAHTPPGGGTGKTGSDSSAQAFGAAIIQGIGQGLGFGDVFKGFAGGKAPWQFGIVKLLAGLLGIASGGDGSDASGGSNASGGIPHLTAGGGLPGPGSLPSLSGPHLGPGNGLPGPGKAGAASSVYSAVKGAGYSDQTALYAVAASLFESGLDPNITNASGHKGLFQMSADKHPGDASQQISWFLGALSAAGGPGVVDADPKNAIADKVEIGGYSGSLYDGKLGEARSLLGGVVPTGAPASFGGGIGVNPASRATSLKLSGSTTNAFDAARARGDETNPPLYAPGLNTGGYGNSAGLPQWAIDLGGQYGLAPSTYPDGGTLHQRGYAFDFAPKPGNPDPAGSMDRFAAMLADKLGPQTLELIHADASTGQKWGIAGGRPVGPGTDMPGYFADDWAGHGDHVHWATDVPPGSDQTYPAAPQAVSSAGYAGSGGVGNIAQGLLTNLPRTLSDLTTAQWAPRTATAMRPASDPQPATPHTVGGGPAVQINQNLSGIMAAKDVSSTVNHAITTASRYTPSSVNAGLHI